ncbi:MAG: NUDIX domain-containing protein [Chlorobi bacterium]|nr:NUDIX domain-containing protein [Chlorobiota bacterium]
MYKIFYQDRIVFLTEDFAEAFRHNYGLFYKYFDRHELQELLRLFGFLTRIKKLYIFYNDLDHLFREFISLFRLLPAAGGVVRSNTGKVLVFNRRGKWDLPKGKIDPGEDAPVTALREIREECGIDDLVPGREITKTIHTYMLDNQPVLKQTTWFDVRYKGDENAVVPQTTEDITEILWLPPEELGMILGNTWLSIIDVLREAGLFRF